MYVRTYKDIGLERKKNKYIKIMKEKTKPYKTGGAASDVKRIKNVKKIYINS